MREKRLRIGVDIATLRPPFTGIANYEIQLLSRLIAQMPEADFLGFGVYRWQEMDAAFLERCHNADTPLPARKNSALRYNTVLHFFRNQIRKYFFSASVEAKRLTLYHAFSYRPPGALKAPVIPVVYDLSTFRHPETHPKSRLQWMKPLEQLCRDAPVIHTISHFTAREIEACFGIPLHKILVIPPGVNALFMQDKPPLPSTLAKFGVQAGSYALTVSTLEPRKNLKTLLVAYAGLPQTIRTSMPLLVIGARGWGDIDLPLEVAALEAEGSVRFLGYVSDEDLRDLYAGARALFYPSIYEGFGMPITEALACGTPVVASQSSSMPEAGGAVSRYVEPLDVDGWRNALQDAAIMNNHLEAPLRIARHMHASTFTWDSAALQVEAMYRDVLRT